MAATERKWEVVQDEPDPERSSKGPEADKVEVASGLGIDLLALGLKTVSQRFVAALINLFTLVTMAGTWFLWYQTPDPNPLQIVHLTIFAVFVLVANWLVRRK